MEQAKLEKLVKKNAALLDKEMDSLTKAHSGKFVSFSAGKMDFSNSFSAALEKGDSEFGVESGFVVRKITKSAPVFACLVQV
jgi:hypothetical protein